MHRAVFLDRDGVLCQTTVRNGKPYAVRTLREFRLMPHAREAVRALAKLGFVVIVVTNQPDLGAGLMEASELDAMHERILTTMPIRQIIVCPHTRVDNCCCRKPKNGMLLQAQREHDLDLPNSFMIGDRASDVEAGLTAGCTTIFIDRRYGEARPTGMHAVARSLSDATRMILSKPQWSQEPTATLASSEKRFTPKP